MPSRRRASMILSLPSITNKPSKSSHLALPPSPFSPLSPLPIQPPHKAHTTTLAALSNLQISPPPTQQPLAWLWQCHICHRVYRLGTTRRCLEDGHYFCAGTTTVKRSRSREKDASGKPIGAKIRVVRHKACASEFDYTAWGLWGEWRRDAARQMVVARKLVEMREEESSWGALLEVGQRGFEAAGAGDGGKDCWMNCDYPSECRWGKKQHVVLTPPATAVVGSSKNCTAVLTEESDVLSANRTQTTPADDRQDELTVFPPIHLDISLSTPDSSPATSPTAYTAVTPESETQDHAPTTSDLLLSAKRRKRRSTGAVPVLVAPSPLGGNPVNPPISSSREDDGSGNRCSNQRGRGGASGGWRWMKKRP